MDLMAPLVHEFTYQAMAHDLLPVKEGDKVTYHVKINQGEEEQDMELQEKDETWVENRHRHMKDTIDTLMSKFQKFVNENPGASDDGNPANLNLIKDMLANMPKYQQLKEAYTLHLAMAEDCMNAFQARKLPEVQSIEQSLATGLDEDLRKAKNLLPEVVRLLDDDAILPIDRERLIMAWLIYRYGVVEEDIKRLLAHAKLYGGEPKSDKLDAILNLQLLGARILAPLKDERKPPEPLFPVDTKQELNEEYGLVRYHPNVKHMLEYFCEGRLDTEVFPFTKQEDQENVELGQVQGSLRAAKPSWASRTGAGAVRRQDNRQRIIVFMAGGATFSESRACYETGDKHNREVFLVTSHMVSPKMFIRQLQDLEVDRNRLDLPVLRKPGLPKWVTEPERPPPPPVMYSQPGQGGAPPPPLKPGMAGGLPAGPKGLPGRPGVPTQQMSSMSIANAPPRPSPVPPSPINGSGSSIAHHSPTASNDSGKLEKKKKRNIFGIKK